MPLERKQMPRGAQVIDMKTGNLTEAWQRYFAQLESLPNVIEDIEASIADHETRITALEP